LRTENCLVPAGATVPDVGLTLVAGLGAGEAEMLMVLDAVLLVFAVLVAIIFTVVAEARVAGAVYKPLTTVPTAGLRDHFTPVLVVPLTVAVNCFVWPGVREGACGVTLILIVEADVVTGAVPVTSIMVELAVFVGSAILVAETDTRVFVVTVLGAV